MLTYHSQSANHMEVSAPMADTLNDANTEPFVDLSPYRNFGMQLSWSGASGVVFQLQASLNGVDWNDIPDGQLTASAGPASHTFNISQLATSQLRIGMSSGAAGTLNVRLVANGAHGKGRLKR